MSLAEAKPAPAAPFAHRGTDAPGRRARSATMPPGATLLPAVAILGLVIAGGCSPESWPLAPVGPQTAQIARLWWIFLAVTGSAWIIMLVVIGWALRRRAHPIDDEPTRNRLGRVVIGATVFVVLTLLVLALLDFRTLSAMNRLSRSRDQLTVRVEGHQWWWEVIYEDPIPARRLTTANELHIPVGRPVRLLVTSRDVIHSLWMPRLHGKHDLVPGYTQEFWIRADESGIYYAACAEFCGLQHANMRLDVVAHDPDDFAAWYESQLSAALPPTDSLRTRGQQVFLGGTCVMCHTIRGTPAGSRVGPDLTHVGSRRRLAAGTLPNTRGHLAGWILDPQRAKPGNRMPPNSMPSEDLNALVAYLEGLR